MNCQLGAPSQKTLLCAIASIHHWLYICTALTENVVKTIH